MTSRPFVVLCAATGLLLLGGGAGITWIAMSRTGASAASASPTTAIGGPFTLTATDGSTVTDETYRGKWLLVYFGYTFCPDACPTALGNIGNALRRLGPLAQSVQALFITIDPHRDTRQVMKAYLKSFDPRIVGLTGSATEITIVAREYGVYVAPQRSSGGDYLIDHSSFVYVMNPAGKFVATLAGTASGAKMAAQLETLLSKTS
jgi:protein SCO1